MDSKKDLVLKDEFNILIMIYVKKNIFFLCFVIIRKYEKSF